MQCVSGEGLRALLKALGVGLKAGGIGACGSGTAANAISRAAGVQATVLLLLLSGAISGAKGCRGCEGRSSM